jgi:hypothetical protein
METTKKERHVLGFTVFAVLLLLLGAFLISAASQPEGPQVNFVENSTKVISGGAGPRSDGKGVITTLTLTATQQNFRWKAYVGNVTGSYVLQDANGYNIYSWASGVTLTGTVIVARNNTVYWSFINCSNATDIQQEEARLSITDSAFDSITNTFLYNNHSSITIAEKTLTECPYMATYINSTAQAANSSNNDFQEIIVASNYTLDDATGIVYTNILFATKIETDIIGYTNLNRTYDFQVIVPDYGSIAVPDLVPYYFYVELV